MLPFRLAENLPLLLEAASEARVPVDDLELVDGCAQRKPAVARHQLR
jgi:hypothetical protein